MSNDDGAARWLLVHDDLLRGLVHDVSNCVATISAVAFMLDGSQPPDERVLQGLRTDAERLEGLLRALRQLPQGGDAGLEPLLVGDVIAQACQLHAHHPDFRMRAVRVEVPDGVVPVLADSTALLHAVCLALVAAMRTGDRLASDTLDVVVGAETVGDVVRLRIAADAPSGRAVAVEWVDELDRDRAAITWLLATSHGTTRPHPFGCELLLPTLQAARRRA